MIAGLIEGIKSVVSAYGSTGVLLAAFAEEVIAPIPSPLIPLTAGFFLLPPALSFLEMVRLNLVLVAGPVALGWVLGALFLYFLAFFGGKAVIRRWGRRLGLPWEEVEQAGRRLSPGRRDEFALFLLRAIPVVPNSAISAFCGVIRYPVRPFLVLTLAGGLVRAFILGWVGAKAGAAYLIYSDAIGRLENYLLLLAAFLAAGFLAWRYFKKR